MCCGSWLHVLAIYNCISCMTDIVICHNCVKELCGCVHGACLLYCDTHIDIMHYMDLFTNDVTICALFDVLARVLARALKDYYCGA